MYINNGWVTLNTERPGASSVPAGPFRFEFVATETMSSRQWSSTASTSAVRDGTSLLERLRDREAGVCPPGTGLHATRTLYQNIPLNTHVASLHPPRPCYVKGFSPCGRYLVVFARELDAIIVYEYTGIPVRCATSDSQFKFEDFFREAHEIRPQGSGFIFHRNAMYFHGNIMVVSWEKASELGHEVPLTMMSSVDLTTGKIIDSANLVAEGVDLSLLNSVSTFRDGRMVVLSPWGLTLLRVDPLGFFSHPQVVGKFCYPDDEEIFSSVYEGEKVLDGTVVPVEQQMYDTLKQRLLACMFFDSQGQQASPAFVSPALVQGASLQPDSVGPSTSASGSSFSGTQHKADPLGLGSAPADLPSGSFQQSTFYYYFRMVVETELTHAQFLDEDRLLLNWGGEFDRSVSHPRMPDGIKAIYNIKTTLYEKVFPPFSHEKLNEFILQDPALLANTRYPSCVWEQFSMDGLHGHHAWTQRNSVDNSERHLYAGIQRCLDRQTSPYLDRELFQYDEKCISKDCWPVSAKRFRTAKFIAHAWPSNLKFALDIDKCMLMSSVGRHQHTNEPDMTESLDRGIHLVYLFHPYQPAVFSIVQSYEEYQGEAEVINVFTYV